MSKTPVLVQVLVLSPSDPDSKIHVANRWAPCWPHEPCYQGRAKCRSFCSGGGVLIDVSMSQIIDMSLICYGSIVLNNPLHDMKIAADYLMILIGLINMLKPNYCWQGNYEMAAVMHSTERTRKLQNIYIYPATTAIIETR